MKYVTLLVDCYAGVGGDWRQETIRIRVDSHLSAKEKSEEAKRAYDNWLYDNASLTFSYREVPE